MNNNDFFNDKYVKKLIEFGNDLEPNEKAIFKKMLVAYVEYLIALRKANGIQSESDEQGD